jgi:predicted branched-subunit amino acid permease
MWCPFVFTVIGIVSAGVKDNSTKKFKIVICTPFTHIYMNIMNKNTQAVDAVLSCVIHTSVYTFSSLFINSNK